jgi:hypothetical protein
VSGRLVDPTATRASAQGDRKRPDAHFREVCTPGLAVHRGRRGAGPCLPDSCNRRAGLPRKKWSLRAG